ncbi:MAG: histidine phosphotransferase family protein [Alphaproteobacteria bacterium]
MADHAKLLEAIVARLCHDLIGPVGAIHNGVELAEESETAYEAAEIMSLVKDSSAQAWGRLAFFRAAFGSGGGQERWTGQEIRDLLTGGLATKRLAFTVSGALATPNFKLTLDQARLAFGLAMAAGECLPRGGVVTLIAGGAPETPTLAAMGDGDRAEIRDETEAALAGGAPEPRAAHVHLLLDRVKTQGRTVEAEANGGKIVWKIA